MFVRFVYSVHFVHFVHWSLSQTLRHKKARIYQPPSAQFFQHFALHPQPKTQHDLSMKSLITIT